MKTFVIAIAAIVVIAAGVVFLTGNNDQTANTSTDVAESGQIESSSQNTQPANDSKNTSTYTLDQVAEHNTANNCWTVIGGSVYDITRYVSAHPGGREILRACGTDATRLFETRTADDGERIGSGSPHSNDARNILNRYRIGELTE